MKIYSVGFWYTEYGTAFIRADSVEDAENKVYKKLQKNGLSELIYKTNDREYGSQDGEETNLESEEDGCLHNFNDGICTTCGAVR